MIAQIQKALKDIARFRFFNSIYTIAILALIICLAFGCIKYFRKERFEDMEDEEYDEDEEPLDEEVIEEYENDEDDIDEEDYEDDEDF